MLTPFSDFVTFFAAVVRSYLPFILVFSLVCALWKRGESPRAHLRLVVLVVVAALCGVSAAKLAITTKYFSEFSLFLSFFLPLFGLLTFLASFLKRRTLTEGVFYLVVVPFLLLLSVRSAVDLWIFIADEALTATSVVNTTLIVNGGALLTGFSVVVLLGILFTVFFNRLSLAAARILFVLFYLLLAVQWLADIFINLIRLDYLKASRGLISYVAKAHDLLVLWNYIFFALAAAVVFLFYLRRHRGVSRRQRDLLSEPERRKRTKYKLVDKRYMTAVVSFLLLGVIAQAWYDIVVASPPELSPAIPVEVGEDGRVRIKIADINDGHLHRYSYITSDGYRVRFFIIQRYADSSKYGVVFDACQICGDDGYIESNNNVICIACNVSIFIPSIGKPGGCNPIPFASTTTSDEIVIEQSELEDGANYFSEKVEIMVSDPVTGAQISNLAAPYHYSYKGHEFSFESEESMKTFINEPESYTSVGRRSVRIDGYKE
ncbi:MAG: hypothetical protein CSB23_03410 [Deltaproteobacteria bacterium]|nr:MAG: hypothetical protein CSB23_03410 [Deltaproteobacteria bacterium]